MIGYLIVSEVTGIMTILLTSIGPFGSSLEQMMGGLSLAGSSMARTGCSGQFLRGVGIDRTWAPHPWSTS